MTILLVDDNDELRAATRELLEALGHRVLEAAGGEEALELAAAGGQDIELLATDFAMPGIDGLELVERLRRLRPAVGALLISSHGNGPDLRQRIAAAGVAFLGKPFSPLALREKIAEALAGTGRAAPPPRVDASVLRASPPAAPRRLPSPAAMPLWAVAAAVGLAMTAAVAIVALDAGPPALPAPPDNAAVRGTALDLVSPVGPQGELPREFRWHEVEDGRAYRLTVQGVDGVVLWRDVIAGDRLEMPAELAGVLRAAVAYVWSVEALDGDGRRIAWSRPTRFRAIPPLPAR